MAELMINEVSKSLQSRLKRRARAKGESLEKYVLAVLKERVTAEETLEKIKPMKLRGKGRMTLKSLRKAREYGRP